VHGARVVCDADGVSSDDTREDRVPPELVGCWRRTWIEYADGTRDDTSFVVWLQLERDMADVRLAADRGSVAGRASFAACTPDELRALTASDSSSGHTRCTPIRLGDDGRRRATAEWPADPNGVAFQPVSAFPEPGLLEWVADDVMIERAPSGAYAEEWRRIPGTSAPFEHHRDGDGGHRYRAGDAMVLVRDRRPALSRAARLDELAAEVGDDRAALVALVDCEFSFARRHGDRFVIEASTLPWREGVAV
jgi:hypothetical protein